MIKIILALIFAVMCVSCTSAPPSEAMNEASETEEAANAVDTADTAGSEHIFESLFDAKKAAFTAEELPLPISMYNEDDIAEFTQIRREFNDVIATGGLTWEAAEEFYVRLTEAKENGLRIKQGDIGRVYITTYKGHLDWEYSPCDVTVVSAEGEKYKANITEGCLISLRGNSTSGGGKPPFNLKFPEKVSMFGMDKGKKWSFLANMYDKSLMRNYLAYYLGGKMGLPYTSMCRYCDVYIDGKLMGNYTVIEPVSIGKGRVEIDENNYEYIFEIDMNRSGLAYYIKPKLGQRLGVSRPTEITDEDRMIIDGFFREMEDALKTHSMKSYSLYIDVESFVNMYIHSEITKSIDVYDFSTRYFLKGGKLYAGPIWDYDLSMGNVSNTCAEDKYYIYCNNPGYGTGTEDTADGVWMDNYWFHELLQDPEFKALVLERFEEVYPIIENLYRDNELGTNVIDWLMEKYGASFVRNYAEDGAGWRIDRQYSGLAKNEQLEFTEEVEWLRSWLERRTEYVAFYLMQ